MTWCPEAWFWRCGARIYLWFVVRSVLSGQIYAVLESVARKRTPCIAGWRRDGPSLVGWTLGEWEVNVEAKRPIIPIIARIVWVPGMMTAEPSTG